MDNAIDALSTFLVPDRHVPFKKNKEYNPAFNNKKEKWLKANVKTRNDPCSKEAVWDGLDETLRLSRIASQEPVQANPPTGKQQKGRNQIS